MICHFSNNDIKTVRRMKIKKIILSSHSLFTRNVKQTLYNNGNTFILLEQMIPASNHSLKYIKKEKTRMRLYIQKDNLRILIKMKIAFPSCAKWYQDNHLFKNKTKLHLLIGISVMLLSSEVILQITNNVSNCISEWSHWNSW